LLLLLSGDAKAREHDVPEYARRADFRIKKRNNSNMRAAIQNNSGRRSQ
jgi:hypothetical protein